MKRLHECGLLAESETTIRETSLDKANNEYMSDSLGPAIDFDSVMNGYIRSLEKRPNAIPSSVDALIEGKDDIIFLVEFKNGDLVGKRTYELHKKARDSVILLGELLDIHIDTMRERFEYIVIYNADKNRVSQKAIQDMVAGFAKSEIVDFGLEQFRSYIFKDVHSYTVDEFEGKVLNERV